MIWAVAFISAVFVVAFPLYSAIVVGSRADKEYYKRVACAKNGDFSRVKESGGSVTAYAWFVWEKGYKGTTTVDWI